MFTDARTWKGYRTPVVTEYNINGYALCDYISVNGCTVNGAFKEFVILSPSSHSEVRNNTRFADHRHDTGDISVNSHSNTITGNVIECYDDPIQLKSCTGSRSPATRSSIGECEVSGFQDVEND